jgi:predicted ATP-dependent endonuclease of OLD family
MKLKSFKIQSYRSCINTELKFNEDLTCLIGINGSGKTNILNSILLLRKQLYSGRILKKDETDYIISKVEIELLYENKTIYLKGDIVFDTDEHNSDFIILFNFKWNFKDYINFQNWFSFPIDSMLNYDIYEEKENELLFIDDKNNNGNINYNQKRFILTGNRSRHSVLLPKEIDEETLKKILKIISEVSDFFSKIYYYSATVFTDPSKCPTSIIIDDKNLSRRNRILVGHDKFIYDLYNLSKTESKGYKKFLNIVNKTGIGLIENITFTEAELPSSSYEVKSAGKINMKNNNRLLVVPSFSVDGVILSPNQLSEGTFKTLALIFYILNDDSQLLLIEEPEVCVHHGLLNNVIELIKTQSKSKQIIISTHSDYILDKLAPENIILVKRDENKGTIAQLLSKSMSKNDFKALKIYLNETGNLGEYWKETGFENE